MHKVKNNIPLSSTNFTEELSDYKTLQPFRYWCEKVLPLVYDDSLSYYEILCKIITYINNLVENQKAFNEILEKNEEDIDRLEEDMETLKQIVDDVRNGKYVDLYLNSIKCYIDENLEKIVSRIVKFVSFGLSDDGYFIAFIPSTWEFISFDTVINPEDKLFGHLILNW